MIKKEHFALKTPTYFHQLTFHWTKNATDNELQYYFMISYFFILCTSQCLKFTNIPNSQCISEFLGDRLSLGYGCLGSL